MCPAAAYIETVEVNGTSQNNIEVWPLTSEKKYIFSHLLLVGISKKKTPKSRHST